MIKPTVQQNMKAARLCGHEYKSTPIYVGSGNKDVAGLAVTGLFQSFNLANPSDLLDTVKALLDMGIVIVKDGKEYAFATLVPNSFEFDEINGDYKTYEEAVLAALDEVSDE